MRPCSRRWRAADLERGGSQTETFAICGDVGAAGFPGWIMRHAARLGLAARVLSQGPVLVQMTVTGPPDLLDAMALGCSLGPQEVMVDQVQRQLANSTGPLEQV